jgi:hypothetical protein
MLWGLYRFQDTKTEWTTVTVSGIDIELIFRSLLKGKFIHCPHTIFFGRDVHQVLALKTKSEDEIIIVGEEFNKRVTGNNNNVKRNPNLLVDSILEKFFNFKDTDFTRYERRKMYHKMAHKFSDWCGYGGVWWIELPKTIKKLRNQIFYPWKVCCRAVKSAIIPGYAEKKREQMEMRKLQEAIYEE